MTKLNISMPEELLAEIDAEADELGLSRSGLIQEASARYVAEARADLLHPAGRLLGAKPRELTVAVGAGLGDVACGSLLDEAAS